MTLTSEIIKDAYRQGNIIPIKATPSADQVSEALRYLNRIVKSSLGNEAGEPLESFPLGRSGIDRPSGYPWYNNVPDIDWWVPKNTRLMLNLTQPVTVSLTPVPDDGSRFAILDVARNLSTLPLTVHGNGRRIEGQEVMIFDVDGVDKEWFYREDLGNWMIYSPLSDETVFPFPEEFDDYFITLLAIRLNPAYGIALDAQSNLIFERSGRQLKARYAQHIQSRSELGLVRGAKTTQDRYQWGRDYGVYDPSAAFDRGWPY